MDVAYAWVCMSSICESFYMKLPYLFKSLSLFLSFSTSIGLWWLITHADRPPIEELHQFLEFQLPRQWAPMYSDLPLGLRHRKQVSPSLQLTFMGPKLYVNTTQVIPFVAAHKNSDTIKFRFSNYPWSHYLDSFVEFTDL